MAAETRWVEYAVSSATSTYIGTTTSGVGTRGYAKADCVDDAFSIGSANSKLSISIDEISDEITLTSGTELDARFVARDITEKMHALKPTEDSWKHATCEWANNRFFIYSGNLGTNSKVTVSSGTGSAITTLGFASNVHADGAVSLRAVANTYNGGITASGTWEGMFDEIYTIIISEKNTIISSNHDAGTYAGTFTTGGQLNAIADDTYTITIDTTGGSTVGGGIGGVPKFGWTSTGADNSSADVEILYSDHWYNVGVKGLKVKWTDSVFSSDVWSVVCEKPDYAYGTTLLGGVGDATYVWTSNRGDECGSSILTTQQTGNRIGSRGLIVDFTGTGNLKAGDEFRVVCTAPQPSTYDINSLNYGNVTVSTESPVKCVLFEIISGAIMMNAVKFGLQNHGTFTYHGTGETAFRYGTVGAGWPAGDSPTEGLEWRENVVPVDLSGTTPTFLSETIDNLPVVTSADDSRAVKNYQGGLVSDFIFLCIRLGSDETGSNSGINFRVFFDYS